MKSFPTLTFQTPTDADLRAGTLGRQLRAYNYRFVGEYPDSQPVRMDARDAQGQLVAGIRAGVFLYWLHTDVLWVHDDHRGQGLGSHLLRMAEHQARELGARHSKLETFEWQARGFYLRHGYEEYARIDNFVPGRYLALMKKALA
jgi:GNAT superfamily N-acetyltransferase